MARYDLSGGLAVQVDQQDVPAYEAHLWRVRKLGNSHYLMRNEDGRPVMFHRQILGVASGFVVDHIDGDGLNNSRRNLRVTTHRRNLWNVRHSTRCFMGVAWSARTGRWRATLETNARRIEIGFFDRPEEAALARDFVSTKLRGEAGSLNFPGHDFAGFDLMSLSPSARHAIFTRR